MMPLLCVSQVLDCGNSIFHEGFKQVWLLLDPRQDNSQVTPQVHGGSFVRQSQLFFISFARRTAAHSPSRSIVALFTCATLLLLATSFTAVASSGD
ncbi:hypothetical protein TNCV_4547621 [Trichonephila clavipes]|nr:hypothetical protein TNCV_4547621 [Trichonephila clavipes]